MGKLTALKVKSAAAGRHADGDGLYLLVAPSGSRSWMLRVQVEGKRRDIGLGSAGALKLQDAREQAAALRKQAKSGVDPVAQRREAKQIMPTFQHAAEACFEEMKGSWRNPKHRAQWLQTLTTYAFPQIGEIKVDQVTAPMIRDVLSPIWLSIPETARRVRQRITTVLDFAHVRGWRLEEAPMRSIGKGLPKQHNADRHFAAMPYHDVPAFVQLLRNQTETIGRLALRFTILTAARSGEVRGATWGEIDREHRLWTVPAERMKARKEHVVPLTDAALAILDAVAPLCSGPESVLFPGKAGKPVSDMTLSKVLRDAKQPVTVHGFRSSFRDWAAEQTSYAGDVVEKALAHTIANKVEAAYRRTNYLEKRRGLMGEWAAFLEGANISIGTAQNTIRQSKEDLT